MAVISVRFNEEEEKILSTLTQYFHADKSSLIKRSIFELHENIGDLKTIEDFEIKEAINSVTFMSAKDILK